MRVTHSRRLMVYYADRDPTGPRCLQRHPQRPDPGRGPEAGRRTILTSLDCQVPFDISHKLATLAQALVLSEDET
jgi:hypothetical protein